MCYMNINKSSEMCVYAFVFSGTCMLQCQAEVFGAPSAEDLRGPSQIQQPEERARAGQTQPHAGACQVEPRVSVNLFFSNKHAKYFSTCENFSQSIQTCFKPLIDYKNSCRLNIFNRLIDYLTSRLSSTFSE